MTLRILSGIFGTAKSQCFRPQTCISVTFEQKRFKIPCAPRLRVPYWHMKKEYDSEDQKLTLCNQQFLSKIVIKKYKEGDTTLVPQSPLKVDPVPRGEWFPGCKRTGLIGVKLGTLPLWTKDGLCVRSTLIQIKENHVINYINPGEREELRPYALKYKKITQHMGDLLVGALNCDPQEYTKEYCGIFNKAGTMPKKVLTKFPINPEAIIQPGTPLYAGHFRVGDYVDITGKTIYRGFQGVMKRWGFHGMRATHGQTKTHRRPGCIGGPGSRVWPGKKMPGHVGNKYRTVRALKILRINHNHNVLYVKGCTPGPVNSILYVHDTLVEPLASKTPPRFPTFYQESEKEPLPEEEYDESIFKFSDPTIKFEIEKATKSKR